MGAPRHFGTAFSVLALLLFAAAGHPARGVEPAAAPAEACQRAKFRVVVDVGHTLEHPGADSARGVPEYAFNLQLARDIKQALTDAGFDNAVLLITATAPWRGLVERAAYANA